jgi:ribosomal protein L1
MSPIKTVSCTIGEKEFKIDQIKENQEEFVSEIKAELEGLKK